jgi:hypothetical protein
MPISFILLEGAIAYGAVQGARFAANSINSNRNERQRRKEEDKRNKKFQSNILDYSILGKFQELFCCSKRVGFFEKSINNLAISL